MNPEAQVARVKCIGEMSERDLEGQLRDVFGLSQKEAKRVIAEGFKSFLSGEARDVQVEQEEAEEKARLLLKEMREDLSAKSLLSQLQISL
jgi:hypothetical protein